MSRQPTPGAVPSSTKDRKEKNTTGANAAMTASHRFARPAQPAEKSITIATSDRTPKHHRRRPPASRNRAPRLGLCFAILASMTFAIASSGLHAQTASEAPKASTSLGAVDGMRRENIEMFLGIPYALPPTGERRLAPPVEPGPWTEPLRGTRQQQRGLPLSQRLESGAVERRGGAPEAGDRLDSWRRLCRRVWRGDPV